MSHKKGKCLLLNSDYTPLSIVDWQKSIVWYLRYIEDANYGIEIIQYHSDQFIMCGNYISYPLPAVARSIKYFNVYNKSINFSRKNLFLRDDYTCQYCGKILGPNQLTYDHVIPKSRYKNIAKHCTDWHNVVTACVVCNRKKGNKTPEEAGMKLLNKPHKPKFCNKYLHWYLQSFIISNDIDHGVWKEFLQST